jgi:CDP-diacylglycerol--glycerol-3-phosphate 3-phosphatidyltransferase
MNLPNKITVTRIFLILIFLILSSVGDINDISGDSFAYWCHIAAYWLAFVAGCTDFVDGWLARRWKMVTDFGALMDPLADKIFVAATYVMMVYAGTVPAYVAIVIIAREFMVTGLRQLAAKKGTVISADNFGKLKTSLQMLIIAVAGACWTNLFGMDINTIGLWYSITLILVTVITVWSGVGYFIRYADLYLKDA